jgi:putative AlgH/UPF0301 family transcriptional regulator
MGLDMYLRGDKFLTTWEEVARPIEDGYEVEERRLALGYWRKHPDLHGFIVKEFASGVDECQDIELDAEGLAKIAEAIRAKRLPHTTGFFFGESSWHDGHEEEYAQTFDKARQWLETKVAGEWRSVTYRASW